MVERLEVQRASEESSESEGGLGQALRRTLTKTKSSSVLHRPPPSRKKNL